MRIFFVILALAILMGCGRREVDLKHDSFNLKVECKQSLAVSFCKYTTKNKISVCFQTDEGVNVPCEFYEDL